jgi:hypothetical protein
MERPTMPPLELPTITNTYQMLAFLIIAGLQVYTRHAVAELAKKQDQMIAVHVATREQALAMLHEAERHIADKAPIHADELVEVVKTAIKVAYLKGQVDTASGNPYPEDKATEGAKLIVNMVAKAARAGMVDTV